MLRRCCSLSLALVPALVLGGATSFPAEAALAAPADDDATEARASLEVDASDLGPGAQALQERIESRGEAVLREREILPGREAGDPKLYIRVESLGSDTSGYRCVYEARRDDVVIDGTTGAAECRLCTQSELIEQVEAAVERMAPRLRASSTEQLAAEPAQEASGESSDEPGMGAAPAGGEVDEERSRALGPVGKGGIGLTVIGAAALGAGVGLMLREPSVLEDEPTKQLDTWKPGLGVAAGGGAVLLAGVTMIIVDAVRRRRGRDASSTALVPWSDGRGGGLAFTGRFSLMPTR